MQTSPNFKTKQHYSPAGPVYKLFISSSTVVYENDAWRCFPGFIYMAAVKRFELGTNILDEPIFPAKIQTTSPNNVHYDLSVWINCVEIYGNLFIVLPPSSPPVVLEVRDNIRYLCCLSMHRQQAKPHSWSSVRATQQAARSSLLWAGPSTPTPVVMLRLRLVSFLNSLENEITFFLSSRTTWKEKRTRGEMKKCSRKCDLVLKIHLPPGCECK